MNVRELVSLTYDEGDPVSVILATIGEQTKSAPASVSALVVQGLTTGKGWLHE